MKTLITLLMLALSAAAFADSEGGQDGNGGGGVIVGGRYMTFYSAGFYTEPKPIAEEMKIPGLNKVLSFLQEFPHLTKASKAELMTALVPSSSRQYFKVQKDKFTNTVRKRLLAEYARVTEQPVESLVIFAVTDSYSKTTYLLPEFYSLKEQDQEAILVHEAYWIVHPKSLYNTVIDAEKSFQAVLDEPEDSARVYDMVKHFGTDSDVFSFVVRDDQRSGALDGLLQEDPVPGIVGAPPLRSECRGYEADRAVPVINVKDLLGEDYLKCGGQLNGCSQYLIPQLYSLKQRFPKSLFIRFLFDKASAGSFGGRFVYPSNSRNEENMWLVFKVNVNMKNQNDMQARVYGVAFHDRLAVRCFGSEALPSNTDEYDGDAGILWFGESPLPEPRMRDPNDLTNGYDANSGGYTESN